MRWQQFSLAALMIVCGTFAPPVSAQPPDGGPEGAGPPAQDEGGERGDRRERGERGGRFGRGGPDGPGGPGGPGGGGGFMRRNPLMLALDTDEDGELSAAEIDNAVVALKKLDKNEDGKVTRDELRPESPGGPGGPGFGGRGGPGGPDGAGPGGPGPEAMVARMMENDKNEDGKLSKDEMPERMLGMFDRANTDGDEFLTKDELTKFAEERATRGGFGGGGRRGQRGPDGEDGGDRPRRPRRPDDVQ